MHGFAFGGGFNLFLAADLRLATASTVIVENFGRLGLTPDLSASYFLPRFCGAARTLDRLWRAPQFSGSEAAALGLISESVATKAELRSRTAALVEGLAQMPGNALDTRRLIYGQTFLDDLQRQLAVEAQQLMSCLERSTTRQALARAVQGAAPTEVSL
jgi:2-(1,2-epoxy-1,2-dihydrophenyl)acetyl-CoA isomerase